MRGGRRHPKSESGHPHRHHAYHLATLPRRRRAATRIVPLVIAILLTFILTPIVIGRNRAELDACWAVVMTVLLAFGMIGAAGWVIGSQIHSLAAELPKHRNEIDAKIASLREGGGTVSKLFQMVREIGKDQAEPKIAKDGEAKAKENTVIVTRPEEASVRNRFFKRRSRFSNRLPTPSLSSSWLFSCFSNARICATG